MHRITLNIDEEEWLYRINRENNFSQLTDTDKNKLIWKLPGLAHLRSLPNLADVEFYGPCKRVKSLMKLELASREANAGSGSRGARRRPDKNVAKLSKGKKSKKAKAA